MLLFLGELAPENAFNGFFVELNVPFSRHFLLAKIIFLEQGIKKVGSYCIGNKTKDRISKWRYVCVSGGSKYSFFGKCGVLCFLVTSVLRFALLPYHRRINVKNFFKKPNQVLELPITLTWMKIKLYYKNVYFDENNQCIIWTDDSFVKTVYSN